MIREVNGSMKIMTEEPFAPVMPLLDFSKLEDVIAAANNTPYGLAAYVFTNDLTVATRMAEGLEAGIIGINDPVPATPQCPFGGMKESGMGRELGMRGPRRLLRNQVRLGRAATELNRILPWRHRARKLDFHLRVSAVRVDKTGSASFCCFCFSFST